MRFKVKLIIKYTPISHMPSRETLKHHLLMAKIKKKHFKDPKSVARGDKRAISKHERLFGAVAKNTNRKYSQRIDRYGFRRLWGFRHFPERSGRIFKFSGHHFHGAKRKKKTAETARGCDFESPGCAWGAWNYRRG